MSIENHIKKLESDHKVLDLKISDMETSGHFDDYELRNLKKTKLKIKDKLERLRKK